RLTYHQKTSSKTENTPIFEMGKKQGSDYQVFGMQMPGRNHQTDTYRYGFQGQEKDDEVKVEGNSINYKYRMHDPRIGRFFAVDPLESDYPHNSPYAFSENRVIDGSELEGLEWERATTVYADGWKVTELTVKLKVKNSSEILTDSEALAFAQNSIPGAEKAFSKEFESKKSVFNIKVELSMDNNSKEGTDFYFNITDATASGEKGKKSYTAGQATGGIGEPVVNKIDLAGTVDGEKKKSAKRTAAHELGHTGGLEHPHDPNGGSNPSITKQYKKGLIPDNLMIQSSKGKGFDVTFEQFQIVLDVIDKHDTYLENVNTKTSSDDGSAKRDNTYVSNPIYLPKSKGRSKTTYSSENYKE
ncbi:MAG: RHS repeat-associated core domain-containing protein, partial [Bacteroidota bacterium]